VDIHVNSIRKDVSLQLDKDFCDMHVTEFLTLFIRKMNGA
jgi:hypothetical protein